MAERATQQPATQMGPTDDRQHGRAPGDRVATVSFGVTLTLVTVALVAVLWRYRSWIPVSDLAVLELRLRAIPDTIPLVGAYSRFGWSHPGPLWDYWMWAPWRLAGGAGVGLLIGMGLLHLLALVAGWITARSRDLAAAVLTASALLIVWASASPGAALIPWNPFVGLLWGGVLVVVGWDAAVRGRRGGLLLLPVASLLLQAHVGTAPLVAGVVMAAVASAVLPWGQTGPFPRRTWGVSLAVAAVLWLPVVWQQFQPEGGNLSALLSGSLGSARGVGAGLVTVADAFSLTPYWWRAEPQILPDTSNPPVLLLLPALASVVALVRRDAVMLRLCAVLGVAVVAAFVAAAKVSDSFSYLVAWIPAVVTVSVALSVWVMTSALGWGRWVRLGSPVVLVAPALGLSWALWTAPPPLEPQSLRVAAAVAATPRDQGVRVSVAAEADALEWVPGMVSDLQRQGVPVAADVPLTWPEPLRDTLPQDPSAEGVVRVQVLTRRGAEVPAGWKVLTESDPFTSEERRRLAQLSARGDDPSLSAGDRALAHLAAAEVRGDRVAWRLLAPATGR